MSKVVNHNSLMTSSGLLFLPLHLVPWLYSSPHKPNSQFILSVIEHEPLINPQTKTVINFPPCLCFLVEINKRKNEKTPLNSLFLTLTLYPSLKSTETKTT